MVRLFVIGGSMGAQVQGDTIESLILRLFAIGGSMGAQVQGDTIESLIQERRDTQKEAKRLQDQIEQLQAKMLEKEDPDSRQAIKGQLDGLKREKKEKAQKLKNICMMARTISAGD